MLQDLSLDEVGSHLLLTAGRFMLVSSRGRFTSGRSVQDCERPTRISASSQKRIAPASGMLAQNAGA